MNSATQPQVIIDTRHLGNGAPDVSIIVPVYNVAPYVAECLESLRAGAGDVNLELIVIDDGSTDGSVGVIEAIIGTGNWPPLLFLRQANRGLSAVRNLGVTLARGEYIGFLDSDDLIDPFALRRMLDLARASGAEVVLGRTEVFDSANQRVSPFYDSQCWDALVNGASWRCTDAGQAPRVLSLEPNANYRLIRRKFYLEQQLQYPEGLFFEDAPVHFRMLLKARRIALLNSLYYRYRINRPGKITEEISQRRFDVLKVMELAIQELKGDMAAPEQAGAALRVLFRLAWGCGIMTLPEHRQAFFAAACAVLGSQVPDSWLDAYLQQHRLDPRHYLLGLMLTGGQASILGDVANQKRPLPAIMAFLLRTVLARFGRLTRAGSQG